MTVLTVRHALAAVLAVACVASFASAGELSKEQCLDAHSRGQDAKEQGKLSLARKLFLTCAQSSCPSLVQGDCARFADELGRQQPSVSFVARDPSGADLPDTTVYVDDVLIVTRLDDGKPHDIDPGKHVIKFSNNGRDRVVTIVIGSGEQGRTVAATFGKPLAVLPVPMSAPKAEPAAEKREPAAKTTTHPAGSRWLIYGGGAVALGGLAFGVFELTRVPASCSVSTNQCSASPGDPVFAQASHATQLANLGFAAGAVGLAALTGGLAWYVTGSKTTKEQMAIAPWATSTSGGLALTGRLP